VLLLLAPIFTQKVSTLDGAVNDLEVSVSALPARIQEGDNTTLTIEMHQATPDKTYTFEINVIDPTGASFAVNATIKTNTTGFGEEAVEYWSDFKDNANTNYVGTYSVAVKNTTTNKAIATTTFTVGLTYQLKHKRSQTVLIKGSGYKANENVTIDIKLKPREISVSGYPKNITADGKGVVNHTWNPKNATPGVYTVSITNATTPGTTKKPSDSQDFYVEVWQVQIQALNLANETVADLTIKVDNKTEVPEEFLGLSESTNQTGWASFMLATGNYTFKGSWKDVPVGRFPTDVSEFVSVENDTVIAQESWVQLLNLKITVLDEATDEPLPFVQLRFKYNYTVEPDKIVTEKIDFETNFTGTVYLRNMFINSSYVIEANRYGFSELSLPPIRNKITPQGKDITIKFPVYTAFVHVADSEGNSVDGVRVEAYEWSSGLAQKGTTDSDGNVTFSLTFGRYIVRVYNGTVFLNETIMDLTQNQSSFVVFLSLYPINFTVVALDYFRQPIPNAMVKIERKTDAKYEATALQGFTGSNGRVTFSNILGGDSRISIYIRGQLGGVKEIHLTSSEQVTFYLTSYVVIGGYAMEASQLVTAIAIAMLVVAFALALGYKRLLKIFRKSK